VLLENEKEECADRPARLLITFQLAIISHETIRSMELWNTFSNYFPLNWPAPKRHSAERRQSFPLNGPPAKNSSFKFQILNYPSCFFHQLDNYIKS